MKKLVFVFAILIFVPTIINAQFNTFQLFDVEDHNYTDDHSVLLELGENSLMMLYRRGDSLFSKTSMNNGIDWSIENLIYSDIVNSISEFEFGATKLTSGRVWVYFKSVFFHSLYSDDNGNSWTELLYLPVGRNVFYQRYSILGAVSQLENTELYFTYSKINSPHVFYIKSMDEGTSWQNEDTLLNIEGSEVQTYAYLSKLADSSLLLITLGEENEEYKIYSRSSTDDGSTWQDKIQIYSSQEEISHLKFSKDTDDKITICFEIRIAPLDNGSFISDLYYIQSDDGLNWTSAIKLTNYPGYDGRPNLFSNSSKTLLAFSSDRENELYSNRIWFAEIGVTQDTSYDPIIFSAGHTYPDSTSFLVEVQTYDDQLIDSVLFKYTINGGEELTKEMFDDGTNGDLIANDFIYSVADNGFTGLDKIVYYVLVRDNDANIVQSDSMDIYLPLSGSEMMKLIDVNNIKLPIDNNGNLADVDLGSGPGGKYDDIVFLFSGGFYLSGLVGNEVWSNGVLSASRIEDYQPGLAGSDPSSPINLIYSIDSHDKPYGEAWKLWRYAVDFGAKFYDGNNDGIYNPLDLNSNGEWDANEDRPDFQGDVTTWSVFNDGVPSDLRRFNDVAPLGIEIKQTVFASNGENTNYDDIIFIRYELENIGTVTSILDSVFFATAVDPDLGNSNDDLIGCDTLENSGYVYNVGPDQEYGNNPPSFFIKLMQGPPVFIPGETFIDNNSDDEYTAGIDTPLDSAVIKRGKFLGMEVIPGAKNIGPYAFTQYMSSHPSHGDPHTKYELRNYLIGGLSKNGIPIDPCTWEFGNGASLLNCHVLNPKFMYSGDPVPNEGWINIQPIDQRLAFSTGPFALKVGEPVELIYAYIVGRGTDHLNSITVAREISQFAQTVYDNNFEDLPTNIDDDENLIADEFKLYQNYPNPFNPTTTIKYQIPVGAKGQMANLKIIVFDMLGREIKTLVNEQKPAGIYELVFDGSKLSSGVYFYQLSTASYVQTKKLMLIK